MKANSSRKLTVIVAALALLSMSMTSCNRGYGCPYEMKTIVKVVVPIIK